jgi:hypothetical protein
LPEKTLNKNSLKCEHKSVLIVYTYDVKARRKRRSRRSRSRFAFLNDAR